MNRLTTILFLAVFLAAGCRGQRDPMPGTWTSVAAASAFSRNATSTIVFRPDNTFEMKVTGPTNEAMEGTYRFDGKLKLVATKLNGKSIGETPQNVELSEDHKSFAFGSLASGTVYRKKS